MKIYKKIFKPVMAMLLILALTAGMINGLSIPVKAAAETIYVSGSTGYFNVKVVNDTTGESDTLKVNVTAKKSASGSNMSAGDSTSSANRVTFSGSVSSPKLGLKLKATQSHNSFIASQDGTISLLMCDLQFTVPAHTSYKSVQKDNANNHTFRLSDSVTTPITGNGSYKDVTVAHSAASYTKSMIMTLNLYECGLREGYKDVHSTIELHIGRNSYSITYALDGGKFKNGNNTTFVNTSNGKTQKMNPTSALDGGEPASSYTNPYFFVEYPAKTGYTFKGWNITGMDNDTHWFYTSSGAKSTTGAVLNTTTDADAAQSTYIPASYMSLRATAGTVTFNALWEANTYTVKYDGNGSTSGYMADRIYTYDKAENLTVNVYIKTGYTFMGWSKNKDASEADYANGESIKNLTSTANGEVTLYAVWVKNSTALADANVLKNVLKMFKVNIIKTDENDETKTLKATFDVYEWSAKLNGGYGAYKSEPSFSIDSNEENIFTYTSDNLGKFKVKETSVEAPYINNGDEMEISVDKCTDIPFYENVKVEEDKGVFLAHAGYGQGDIVRDSADLDNAVFYQAKVANTGHSLSETGFWLKINESNYSKYDRLVSGAGKWDVSDQFAHVFSDVFTNGKGPQSGATFSLRKKDETGSLLSGAEFNVYYADDNTLCRALNENAIKNGLYGTNIDSDGDYDNYKIPVDERQTHAVLNDDGTKTLELIVKEDKAPDNHKKIDDFKVTAHIVYDDDTDMWNTVSLTASFSDGQTQTILDGGTFDAPELVDDSYKLNLTVVKKSKGGVYGVSDLAGAEYAVYEDEELTLPVTTITIKSDGTGTAENLPLRDYWVRETKVPDSGKFLLSKEIKHIEAADAENNGNATFKTEATFEEDWIKGKLRVHKIDKNGDDLDGATFSIYNCPDSVTEETLSDYDYKEAAAAATEEVKDGYADFTEIPFGRYILVETVVPDGYQKAPDRIVTVSKESSDSEVTVVNKETEVRIYKTDLSGKNYLEGAVFKIYDVAKGSYIMQDTVTIDENGNEAVSQEEKLFTTDENGLVTVNGLSKGSYRIEEVAAPDGFVIDSRPQTITIADGNENGTDSDGTPFYQVSFKDSRTETWFTKVDITTKEEIAGGEYTLKDSDGNEIEHWTGTGESHKIYGLVQGKTYTITEDIAPDGYTVAMDVTFKVNEDGTITKVVMEDDYNKVEISKRDITTDEELPGAKLEIFDSDGNLYDSWISEDKPHRIDRMPVGTYTFKETQAPDGYIIAQSITFEVGESGEVQEVVMYDDYTKTRFIKLSSDTGEPLKGCVLQVLDKDKKVVEEWTTDGTAHEVYRLTAGETYYLHEVSAPDDYQLADDMEFVAGKQWSDGNATTEDDYNKMDGTTFTDQGGNEVNFDDGKVDTKAPEDDYEPETEEPDNYTPDGEDGVVEETELDEIPEDDGYDSSAADMVTITMLDRPKLVSILKKTEAGDLLDGAQMQLLDADGNILHSWTSGANVSSVFRLPNGKYTIHEEYAPENYELAEDITFEVTDDTTEVEYEMVDKYTGGSIKVVKVDDKTNKPIEGVEFTLIGENGLKFTGKTDKDGELVFGVKDGKSVLPPQKYTLIESRSANGYSLLKDPVEITLPLKLTQAEASAQNADTSKAKWDKENEVYRFYDLTYNVSDSATLNLPATGSYAMAYGIIAGAMIFVLACLFLALRKKRRADE